MTRTIKRKINKIKNFIEWFLAWCMVLIASVTPIVFIVWFFYMLYK